MSHSKDNENPDPEDVEDYGAEAAPDDSAPDIVRRGAKKDKSDAETRRRRSD